MPRIKIVCRECGSEDVLSDAYAAWNRRAQRWELVDTFDKGAHCNACDGETRLDEIEIKPRRRAGNKKGRLAAPLPAASA